MQQEAVASGLLRRVERAGKVIGKSPHSGRCGSGAVQGLQVQLKDGNGRSCEGYWYELSEYDVTVKDDDFCSYGEGKDYD